MPVYLPTRSTPNCLPREPTLAKLWRRGNDCPMLDQRPFINADNQHMHRSGGGHVSLKSRQSPPPGDVKRYRTDSADVPLICLHKRLLQRPIGKLSFGICVSESAIQTY
ncbi:hypothetical protein Poly59_61240 [Rubripirellula reticaptiva]|uniref:Uncharacterized protein n=1 Tax=Rubripirellula reticaptiva TaxID=2528013 RepID=A0A5C6E9X8_9BACT|nr:hypothetical protein Poly59_61240 [Rubripirellula reticaptiva]